MKGVSTSPTSITPAPLARIPFFNAATSEGLLGRMSCPTMTDPLPPDSPRSMRPAATPMFVAVASSSGVG